MKSAFWVRSLALLMTAGSLVGCDDGVESEEEDFTSAQATLLEFEFPDTLSPRVEPAGTTDFEESIAPALAPQPLVGRHVLVLAGRREVRNVVREALRPMGLMVDFVTSIEEAREFCDGGMPHALLYESALGGDRFERLRKELLADMPHLVFVELADDGQGVVTRKVGAVSFSRVSLSSAIESLPPTLMFELSRPR